MALFTLNISQDIPATREAVWDYISSPMNLQHLTPDYMDFRVTSQDLPEKMYQGMMIHYRVRPMLGIPITWVTEITHVEDQKFFVDEQRVGPYKIWHHQHHLEDCKGGTSMKDIVSYCPPMGFLGTIANKFFIRRQLEGIFDYRRKKLEEIFGRLTP